MTGVQTCALPISVSGVKPYTALQLEGRDIFIREGCGNCHSQMIRPFRAETERYGHYSVAGEFVYDHPFLWGSKRTGPDLARVGLRYSDEWHRAHLNNPRDVVPESNMPAYAFLEATPLDASTLPAKMKALRAVGVPYTDDDIAKSQDAVKGKTEQDALIAYLAGETPHVDLPLDVRATAFQRRVWQELIAIPLGETRSYSEIAERLGYFKDAGLDVEISDVQSGARTLQSIVGNSADIGVGTFDHAIQMQAKNQPVIALVQYGRYPGFVLATIASKNVRYTGPQDLKGLKIGVTSPGDRKSTRLNSSHMSESRMPSSA